MKLIIIQLTLFFGVSASADFGGSAGARSSLESFAIAQGTTDQGATQLAVLHSKSQALQFYAQGQTTGRQFSANNVSIHVRDFSEWAITKVSFAGLSNREPYSLLIEDAQGRLLERREFRLLDEEQRHVRIAAVSCAAGYLYRSDIWQTLNKLGPDMVFFLGDNVYADRPHWYLKRKADEKQLWNQYVSARLRYDFFRRRELIPVVATWDDHDFGADNADRTYAYAHAAREIFNIFWPLDEGVSQFLRRGPGVSSELKAFGMDFLFLDNRSFRSSPSDGEQSMWGGEGRLWIEDRARSSEGLLWLINGGQFFGPDTDQFSVIAESPGDLQWLLPVLRQRTAPTAFLSGDVHFSEVMNLESEILGWPSYEITSSSMHSITFPWHHLRHSNSRRVAATSRHNFVLLELYVGEQDVWGRGTSYAASGEELFRVDLTWGWDGMRPRGSLIPPIQLLPKSRQGITEAEKFDAGSAPVVGP